MIKIKYILKGRDYSLCLFYLVKLLFYLYEIKNIQKSFKKYITNYIVLELDNIKNFIKFIIYKKK